jgi:protoheme IX farnesyltransferase
MSIALHKSGTLLDYVEVLKPRETALLLFIGGCSAFIATAGISWNMYTMLLTMLAIGLGSAGCNGLTNYLDSDVDSKMTRTCSRALPSGRIYPPQKALPIIIIFIITALGLAWRLHPVCFIMGIVGVIASSAWRKTATCTFFGIVAGCSPVVIGWFALNPVFELKLLLICLLVALWIPIHVWSVMLAKRHEYVNAGLTYFPLNLKRTTVVNVLFVLSVCLSVTALTLFFITDFKVLYVSVAVMMGTLMVLANIRLLKSNNSVAAWKLYKLSSFPYLGFIFFAMCLDMFLL